ncbi:MAG: AAA family ATPase [Chitinophagaceae bacterium]
MHNIAVIGPESTGKSTLCEQLAQHYQCYWCTEYARNYLTTHGQAYNYPTLLHIATAQQEQIHALRQMATAAHHQHFFVDTEMIVMQVWCEYVFGNCHPYIIEQAQQQQFSLYLLCKPDIPWVQDGLREYPNELQRIELYHYYKSILEAQELPFVIIDGSYEQRLTKAIQAINTLT